jgi:hypothetical protein
MAVCGKSWTSVPLSHMTIFFMSVLSRHRLQPEHRRG